MVLIVVVMITDTGGANAWQYFLFYNIVAALQLQGPVFSPQLDLLVLPVLVWVSSGVSGFFPLPKNMQT